jgi:hypothetical protein
MSVLPPINEKAEPEALARDILAYIDAADRHVSARDTVHLVELNDAVDVLCSRILALDAEQAKGFAPKLQELMARLTALQTHMQTAQSELAQALKSLSKSQKAAHAYSAVLLLRSEPSSA